jgi:hypothetical protein
MGAQADGRRQHRARVAGRRPVPNDPLTEWMFSALEPHPPASQKRLIVQARRDDIKIIDDMTAEVLISVLGLKEE